MIKVIIKPNNAIASVNAKPKIAYANNCLSNDEFRANATSNEPKTTPIPTPEPAKEIVAKPAPINLQPNKNIF